MVNFGFVFGISIWVRENRFKNTMQKMIYINFIITISNSEEIMQGIKIIA